MGSTNVPKVVICLGRAYVIPTNHALCWAARRSDLFASQQKWKGLDYFRVSSSCGRGGHFVRRAWGHAEDFGFCPEFRDSAFPLRNMGILEVSSRPNNCIAIGVLLLPKDKPQFCR